MSLGGGISSLINQSLFVFVNNISTSSYKENIEYFPPNLKSRLLHLLCKRGLLTDENISYCLHPGIKEIDLSESEVSDVGLKTLVKRCKTLRKIDLNATKGNRGNVTSVGVTAVAEQCAQLQTVYLRRCVNLSDAGVVSLAEKCRRLKQLNIGGCSGVSDASLVALGRHCTCLAHVNFSSTAVTDTGVNALCSGRCKFTLSEVHMNQCENLTDDAVECVARSCEKLDVLLIHGCPLMTDRARIAIEQGFRGRVAMKQVTWTIY